MEAAVERELVEGARAAAVAATEGVAETPAARRRLLDPVFLDPGSLERAVAVPCQEGTVAAVEAMAMGS